jgi:hypothetical protein
MTPLRLADERLLVWVHTVAPVVVAEPQPAPLGRIRFGGIRRQEERRYSPWPLELLRGVPAGPVQDHHSVLAWTKLCGRCIKELLRGSGIRFPVRSHHRPSGHWIDDAEYPDRLPTVLAYDHRPRPRGGPHRSQCSLLPESRLILKPDANLRARPPRPQPVHKQGARRLKALAAAGSCRGCLGRGLRQTNP